MESLTILMPVLWFDEVIGGWTYFKEMAQKLADAGLKVIVLSPRARGNKQKEEFKKITVYRYRSIYVPKIPLLLIDPINFFLTLKRVIQEHKSVDIIYDTTSGLLPSSIFIKFFFRLKGKKVPLVVHVHGELKEFSSRQILSLMFELYLHFVTAVCFYEANKLLVTGEKIIPRILSLGAPIRKIKIIRVGLKYEDKLLHHFSALSDVRRTELRASIGLSEKDFIVGYVGRLSIGKGLDTLLKAIALIKDKIPKIKILLVGEGGERERLEDLASKLGISNLVLFLGHREDILDLLQIMDVFVNLSKSEAGISSSQLEAMRVGLPSVISPFTDLLDNYKETIIVPFNNPKAVASAILLLYQDKDLRKAIGKNASIKAQAILKLYAWNHYVNETLQVFKNLTYSLVEVH